jgi:hypothetical protein
MKKYFSGNTWILNIGANCHNCRSMEGLTELKEINKCVNIGSGESMKATKIGILKFEATQINGVKFTVMLNDVKYVPNICVNLFSLKKAFKKRFNVSNDGVIVSLN